MTRRKTFKLDKIEGKFLGVCSGLANYTGVDATIIRVGLVLVTLAGLFPWTVVAYFVAAWAAKPKRLAEYEGEALSPPRSEARERLRDLDQRMAAIESYVTSSNTSLAQEIDALR
jgi:phage shock protein C